MPDIQSLRDQFPSVRDNHAIFFDNPAGTQVPERVINAVRDYYTYANANGGGHFATSQKSDELTHEARALLADFLNAPRVEEVVIGPNMTTLNFALSRAIGKTLQAGDNIVLTRMDHDANIAPWLHIAEDYALEVRWVSIKLDGTLDMDGLRAAVDEGTKVVATTHASNVLGTINPVDEIAAIAHSVGALHVVDAVQSAPHIPLDVQAIGCDFLLCSAYKFYGPHIGILWGRYELLAELPAYKVRPAKDKPPYRWETGTPSFETIHATGQAIAYFAEIGVAFGAPYADQFPTMAGRRLDIHTGMAALSAYEGELTAQLIAGLKAIDGVTIYGISDPERFGERVPTVIFTLDGHAPADVATALGKQDIYVWNGHNYAIEAMDSLGHAEHGMVRVGIAHYNTPAEIDRLLDALRQL